MLTQSEDVSEYVDKLLKKSECVLESGSNNTGDVITTTLKLVQDQSKGFAVTVRL